MKVQGCDCAIVLRVGEREMAVPYTEETIREGSALLVQDASLEGDGVCRAIRKRGGAAGCVVAPLTISTAPLLLCLALGAAGNPIYVSETRSLYRHALSLAALEDSLRFGLAQDRGGERRLYEGCQATGFELRVDRDEAIKLKLDISGEWPPVPYPYLDIPCIGRGTVQWHWRRVLY